MPFYTLLPCVLQVFLAILNGVRWSTCARPTDLVVIVIFVVVVVGHTLDSQRGKQKPSNSEGLDTCVCSPKATTTPLLCPTSRHIFIYSGLIYLYFLHSHGYLLQIAKGLQSSACRWPSSTSVEMGLSWRPAHRRSRNHLQPTKRPFLQSAEGPTAVYEPWTM